MGSCHGGSAERGGGGEGGIMVKKSEDDEEEGPAEGQRIRQQRPASGVSTRLGPRPANALPGTLRAAEGAPAALGPSVVPAPDVPLDVAPVSSAESARKCGAASGIAPLRRRRLSAFQASPPVFQLLSDTMFLPLKLPLQAVDLEVF